MTFAEEMKLEGIEQVALNMLKLDVRESIIIEATKLSKERLAELKQEQKLPNSFL